MSPLSLLSLRRDVGLRKLLLCKCTLPEVPAHGHVTGSVTTQIRYSCILLLVFLVTALEKGGKEVMRHSAAIMEAHAGRGGAHRGFQQERQGQHERLRGASGLHGWVGSP